jgi:prepilin-type N-terminal cleavage/methylation domain-containing protein
MKTRWLKKKNKSKGFTLVELLASITIIGILVVIGVSGVTKLITKSKTTQFEQQQKNVSMATESYLQANKQSMPKNIGDSVNVPLKDLLNSNYLTDEVKNTNNESCMENSYVRVYKYSKTEYTYTPFIYCGNDEVPVTEAAPEPIITIQLTDDTDSTDKKVFNNVSAATMNVTIKGGDANGTAIAIDGYLFAISTKKSASDDYKEVYNSGTLSANKENTIQIRKKISDYVTLAGSTYVKVKVVATNVSGGTKTLEVSATEDGTGIYNDTIKPICNTISNQAKDEDDWVNKAAVAVNKFRTITVDCLDGDGSGCLRPSFTVSWPSNSEPNKEYSYIEIKDNNDNTQKCRVRVNVDQVAPTIVVKAYVATNDSLDYQGDNILTSKKYTAKDDDSPVTIKATEYSNVQGGSWLNNHYYPYGVVYTIDATDNLHLYRWTWETNESYITDYKSSNYNVTDLSNPDATSGYFSTRDLNVYDNGVENEQIKFGFITEGRRYGVLTVYDRAGNFTQFYIKADIDRTAPPVPTTDYTYTATGSTYTEKTWTNKSVTATVQTSYKRDNLSNSGKTTLAGWDRFEYEIRYHGVSATANASLFGTSDDFVVKNNSTFEGRDKVRWRNCDKANNCSAYNDDFNVYIDITAPRCNLSSTDSLGRNYTGYWLKIGETTTVTSTCDDAMYDISDKNSGCYDGGSFPKQFSYSYLSDITIDKAGALGVNAPGKVKDIAGNVTTCQMMTVKIDHTNPTCTVTANKNNGQAYNGQWLNSREYAIVKAHCTDPTVNSVYTNTQTSSTCYTPDFSFSYNYDYDIRNGGALGVGSGGTVRDVAGNTVSCAADKTIKVDHTPPTCNTYASSTTETPYNGKWQKINESVTISASCTDNVTNNASSGCVTSPFSHTFNSNWNGQGGAGSNGTAGTVADLSGNVTTCRTYNVRVDHERPSCSVSASTNNWTNQNVTVTARCSDTGGSGCATSSFSHTYTSNTNISNGGARGQGSGGSFSDNAGNSVNCAANQPVRIDKTAPSVSCYMSGNTAVASASDSGGSGLSSKMYSFDGGASYGWSNSGSVGCDQTKYVYARAMDNAGNANFAYCGYIKGESCCSNSNFGRCPTTVACRSGITNLHNAGVVCRDAHAASYWASNPGGKSCSGTTTVYITGTSGDKYNACARGGDGGSWVSGGCGWIYQRCTGWGYCSSGTCPD